MAAVNGQGTTVTFGTSSFVANIVSINFGEVTPESLETSYLATTVPKTFTPRTCTTPARCLSFW